MEERSEYLTASEVAKRLNVSSRSVRRWIAEGTLPGARFGRQYRVRESDLEALERHHRSESIEIDEVDDSEWLEVSSRAFVEDWDNPLDTIYDEWETLYADEIARRKRVDPSSDGRFSPDEERPQIAESREEQE